MSYYQPLIIAVGLPSYQHYPYGYWGSRMPHHTGYYASYHHWHHGYSYHHDWQRIPINFRNLRNGDNSFIISKFF